MLSYIAKEDITIIIQLLCSEVTIQRRNVNTHRWQMFKNASTKQEIKNEEEETTEQRPNVKTIFVKF
jgi:hypothetical protein